MAQVIEALKELTNAIIEYLKFPLVTRARNFFTEEGAKELALFEPDMQDSFNLMCVSSFSSLSLLFFW